MLVPKWLGQEIVKVSSRRPRSVLCVEVQAMKKGDVFYVVAVSEQVLEQIRFSESVLNVRSKKWILRITLVAR